MKNLKTIVLLLLLVTQAYSQQVIRGPYLQVLTSESVQICWRTDAATDSRVTYGTSQNGQTLSVTDATPKTDHFVTISGLNAATFYYYSVGNAATILAGNQANFRFKTAPNSGTVAPYRFWVIGDFGKANQGQTDVMNSYLNYNGATHTDFWLWLGDNAYSDGTQQEYQNKVFNVYDSILPFLPIFSTPGNHDYNSVNRFDPPLQHTGPYYDILNSPIAGEAGGVASNTELYYSFDYGNIHFISLNSEIQAWTSSNNSQMFNWLRQDLQANNKEWVICYFHQPPYSRGSHNSDDIWELLMLAMRQNALPILEQYGVDLVLCGHSHVYERSKFIKGHYGYSFTYNDNTHAVSTASGNYNQGEQYLKYLNGTNEGTVYVVCGNSGSSESGSSLNHPVMIASDGGSNDFGSLVIDVNGNRLDCKYLKSNGVVHDEFTIIKPDGSTPVISNLEQTTQIINPRLFPNPSQDLIQVEFGLATETEIDFSIFDMSGKTLHQEHTKAFSGENRKKIDVSKLPSGNYILNIQSAKENIALPFTKK